MAVTEIAQLEVEIQGIPTDANGVPIPGSAQIKADLLKITADLSVAFSGVNATIQAQVKPFLGCENINVM